MAEKNKEVKPVSKVRLRVHSQESATIIRNEGLPMITDRTEKTVTWLAANGFQAGEIEILGEKPSNWDEVFPPATVEELLTQKTEI
jgi:ABC-type sugar transport system substrate-binding protein